MRRHPYRWEENGDRVFHEPDERRVDGERWIAEHAEQAENGRGEEHVVLEIFMESVLRDLRLFLHGARSIGTPFHPPILASEIFTQPRIGELPAR